MVQFLDFLAARPVLAGVLIYALVYVPYRLRAKRRNKLRGEAQSQALAVYEAQRPYAERMYDPVDDSLAVPDASLEPPSARRLPSSKAA